MVYTANLNNSLPTPTEPGVLSVYLANSAGTSDVVVYVPWKDCRLAYAYTACVATVDTAAAMAIDLELNAAGGTAIGTITIAASSAIGDLDELTGLDAVAAAKNLDREDASVDAINCEVTGTNATGAAMLFLYFEPEVNQ